MSNLADLIYDFRVYQAATPEQAASMARKKARMAQQAAQNWNYMASLAEQAKDFPALLDALEEEARQIQDWRQRQDALEAVANLRQQRQQDAATEGAAHE